MQKTINGAELKRRINVAKLMPQFAHLPAFGLMAPCGWDYADSELICLAEKILRREGIMFSRIKETAPALFWYYTADGDFHLHTWDR